MKLELSRQIFEKYSNMKFHKNPISGSRVVPCGRTDGRTDRETDMTKLIVASRNFAKAPEKYVSARQRERERERERERCGEGQAASII
jgi:hypothetical protein